MLGGRSSLVMMKQCLMINYQLQPATIWKYFYYQPSLIGLKSLAKSELELDSTMSQSWIEFWNWILNLTQNNLSQLFKSTVKIWAKLNIRNLVKNYPVLQVWSWICGGLGSWLVLKSFSLGQVSLLWKFELNWMSGCWEKFLWVALVGGTTAE